MRHVLLRVPVCIQIAALIIRLILVGTSLVPNVDSMLLLELCHLSGLLINLRVSTSFFALLTNIATALGLVGIETDRFNID